MVMELILCLYQKLYLITNVMFYLLRKLISYLCYFDVIAESNNFLFLKFVDRGPKTKFA